MIKCFFWLLIWSGHCESAWFQRTYNQIKTGKSTCLSFMRSEPGHSCMSSGQKWCCPLALWWCYQKRVAQQSKWEEYWGEEKIPKVPQRERGWRELAFSSWLADNTLKLGWWGTGDWTAFQKICSLWAGKGRIVHQRWVGNTTIKGHAAHNPVPVPRGTCEQNFLLETENFFPSRSHKKAYQSRFQALAESWWLLVQTFKIGKMIMPCSLLRPCWLDIGLQYPGRLLLTVPVSVRESWNGDTPPGQLLVASLVLLDPLYALLHHALCPYRFHASGCAQA